MSHEALFTTLPSELDLLAQDAANAREAFNEKLRAEGFRLEVGRKEILAGRPMIPARTLEQSRQFHNDKLDTLIQLQNEAGTLRAKCFITESERAAIVAWLNDARREYEKSRDGAEAKGMNFIVISPTVGQALGTSIVVVVTALAGVFLLKMSGSEIKDNVIIPCLKPLETVGKGVEKALEGLGKGFEGALPLLAIALILILFLLLGK